LQPATILGTRAGTRRHLAWANRSLVALLLLVILPGAAHRPQSGPPQSGQPDKGTIRIKVDLVVLRATVQHTDRSLVSGLSKDDFQVYEDGVLQRIESFSHEDIPVTVGLVVDNSGSMRPKQAEVVAAAMAFARSSHPADQMFVVHFNEKVTFGLPDNRPFTDKQAELQEALSRINADGKTALYDAVAAALEHLRKGTQDKKVLIVITDGADNASQHNLDQIMVMATQSDTIIYTIGLFAEGDPDGKPGVLKHLSKATGGEAFLPESITQIVPVCEQIARDIRTQYTITYVPTNTKQDGAYRAIQVKAAAPGHGRLIVRTRTGYAVPLKPQLQPAASNRP
jgi:Ca-activated chloride channel family protein